MSIYKWRIWGREKWHNLGMGTRLVSCISWIWTQAVQLQSPYTQNIMSSVSCQEEYLLSCDYVLRELFYLDQWFLMGKSCPQGHIWQCLETFLVVTTWGQEDDWCLVDRDQGRCKTSYNIQDNAYNEDLPDPNVSSTEVEKPWHEATRGRSILWTFLHLNKTKLRLTEMRYVPQVDTVTTERGPEPETSDFAVQGPNPPRAPTVLLCRAASLLSERLFSPPWLYFGNYIYGKFESTTQWILLYLSPRSKL